MSNPSSHDELAQLRERAYGARGGAPLSPDDVARLHELEGRTPASEPSRMGEARDGSDEAVTVALAPEAPKRRWRVPLAASGAVGMVAFFAGVLVARVPTTSLAVDEMADYPPEVRDSYSRVEKVVPWDDSAGPIWNNDDDPDYDGWSGIAGGGTLGCAALDRAGDLNVKCVSLGYHYPVGMIFPLEDGATFAVTFHKDGSWTTTYANVDQAVPEVEDP